MWAGQKRGARIGLPKGMGQFELWCPYRPYSRAQTVGLICGFDRGLPARHYPCNTLTLDACLPLRPSMTSKDTLSPRSRSPLWGIQHVACTNTSLPYRLHPDEANERRSCAIAFLRASVRYFAELGVTVRRVLTGTGSACRSKRFAAACRRACTSSNKSPAPTARRPTAKPNASSNRPCANGPTASPISTLPSEPPCSVAGFTITTGIARTKASAAWHPSVASLGPETTS
jgi:hypothetical protein